MSSPKKNLRDLMDYLSHCHECGALMVTVPGGAICPNCGFELDDPAEEVRSSFRRRFDASGDKAGDSLCLFFDAAA